MREDVKLGVIDMMQAVFDLCEAGEREPDFSINDLVEVMKLAVAEGHEKIEMYLSMWSIAAGIFSKERRQSAHKCNQSECPSCNNPAPTYAGMGH